MDHVETTQAPVEKPFDAEGLIEIYLQLRDRKRLLEKVHEEQLKPYTERMLKIEQALHHYMQNHRLISLPTDRGTAYTSTKSSASVADAALFRGHVIETRSWDLADWRANATAVKAFIEEHQTPVPGVNLKEFESVRVRRSTEKD